VLSKEILGYYM